MIIGALYLKSGVNSENIALQNNMIWFINSVTQYQLAFIAVPIVIQKSRSSLWRPKTNGDAMRETP